MPRVDYPFSIARLFIARESISKFFSRHLALNVHSLLANQLHAPRLDQFYLNTGRLSCHIESGIIARRPRVCANRETNSLALGHEIQSRRRDKVASISDQQPLEFLSFSYTCERRVTRRPRKRGRVNVRKGEDEARSGERCDVARIN